MTTTTLKSLTLTVCFIAGIAAAPLPDSPETSVRAKLADFHSTAVKASATASDLASLSRSEDTGWESHATDWNYLKASINDMGRTLSDLESLRGSATPGEREAIDHAASVLKQMSQTTGSAIHFINNDQEDLWRPSYQKFVDQVGDESSRLSTSLGQFLRLEDLHAREKHLEKTLSSESAE